MLERTGEIFKKCSYIWLESSSVCSFLKTDIWESGDYKGNGEYWMQGRCGGGYFHLEGGGGGGGGGA